VYLVSAREVDYQILYAAARRIKLPVVIPPKMNTRSDERKKTYVPPIVVENCAIVT
jgi:hypothetical protein